MGTIRRQSIQATLVMAVGVALGFILKLYVFTAYLAPEEIGLLAVLLDAANLFAAFIPLGSQSIFVKYLPHFKSGERSVRGLLFLGTAMAMVGFAVFALLFLIFRQDLVEFYSKQAPLFADYVLYLLPLVLVRVIFIIGMGYSRALKKNVFPTVIKEIIVRVLTGILVLAFAYKWFDIDGLVFWYVALYFVSGAIMTYYIFHLGHLNLRPQLAKLKGGMGREILQFGLFAVMTSAGTIIIRNIDSLMIMTLKGLHDAGIYNIAFFLGLLIEMPRRAVSQITAPFIAEASAKNHKTQIATLYHKSSVNQFLIGAIILVCVWTNIDSLFEIIPNGNTYEAGKYVILFVGLGKLFDMSMGVNNEIIQNSPYYRFNFYIMSTLAVLGVATNLIFIPRYGILGAAMASLISISTVNIAKAWYIRLKFGLQPFRPNSIIAFTIAAAAYLVAIAIPYLGHPVIDILLRSATSVLLFFGLSIRFKVSEDFNELYRQSLNRLKKR